MGDSLILPRPDDWHLHLRDGEMLDAVTPWSSAHFGRAIIMPNLVPPVVTCNDAAAYRARVIAAAPTGHRFTPLMTLYLTETTDPDDVAAGFETGLVKAVKLYPAGATTNSDSGVRDIAKVDRVLDRMAQIGMPLLVHGEVTDPEIDIFDRERVFIEQVLESLRKRHPALKVVMEHITTAEAVDYVMAVESGLAATITVHHLIINRNALLAGGIRPHYYCLPVAKREKHRLRLVEAATSGDRRFFLGTDSAPHPTSAKEAPCGCAGVFTAPNALPCLAHVFEAADALDMLEMFACGNGPDFYDLPVNEEMVRLVKTDQPIEMPPVIRAGDETVTVFDPGFPLHWHVESEDAL